MNKTLVKISNCKSGTVLAENVVTRYGSILIVKNTKVNEYLKFKLDCFHISDVWIYSEKENDEDASYIKLKKDYEINVLQMKGLFNDLANGRKLESDKINNISRQIYSHIDNFNVINLLSNIKSADEYTFSHSLNVGFYCMLYASGNNFSEKEALELIQSGLLHDIGKTKVDLTVLNKPGKLTDGEFREIKNHSTYGYEIVKYDMNISENVKQAILGHHERQDGSGYPYGINGRDIGEFAKIVALCDVYDAITSERVYKGRRTPFEAFKFFQTKGVGIFDTHILNYFVHNIAAMLVGLKVLLSNGKIGEIVYVPLHDVANPIIAVDSTFIDIGKAKDISIVSLV